MALKLVLEELKAEEGYSKEDGGGLTCSVTLFSPRDVAHCHQVSVTDYKKGFDINPADYEKC